MKRDTFVFGGTGVSASAHPVVVGVVAGGIEHLLPIDDIVVAILYGSHVHGSQVRTSVRLGVANGEVDLAAGNPRQILILYVITPIV